MSADGARRSRIGLYLRGGERHATWLELFFDLVFVVAVAQLARYLHDHLTVGGAIEFLFLMLPVWSAWMGFSYFADLFDVKDGAVTGVDLWYELRRAVALFKRQEQPARPAGERLRWRRHREKDRGVKVALETVWSVTQSCVQLLPPITRGLVLLGWIVAYIMSPASAVEIAPAEIASLTKWLSSPTWSP